MKQNYDIIKIDIDIDHPDGYCVNSFETTVVLESKHKLTNEEMLTQICNDLLKTNKNPYVVLPLKGKKVCLKDSDNRVPILNTDSLDSDTKIIIANTLLEVLVDLQGHGYNVSSAKDKIEDLLGDIQSIMNGVIPESVGTGFVIDSEDKINGLIDLLETMRDGEPEDVKEVLEKLKGNDDTPTVH